MKIDYFYLCDNHYDSAFDKISGLYRYPWIGSKYDESKCRILILGDSHYAVDENGNESKEEVKNFRKNKFSTREIVNCVINNVCLNESTWTMFRNLIATFTSITPKEVKDLWSKVAFYNFIQEPMKKRDQEPSSEEEQNGWRCFCEVIDIIAPHFCIFIGKRRSQEINTIKNLCTKFTLSEDQDICNRVHPLYGEIVTKKGILTQYLIIKHTSSYYSPDAWYKYLKNKRPEIIAQLDSHFKNNMFTYISNSAHYKEVLSRVLHVKESLWIGTADIKDLYIEDSKSKKPFLEVLAKLIKKGVAVRLIHAKEPGPNFREDFDRFPILYEGLERVLCPRVHFKMMVFDGKEAYIGSANLTGAGIGMKADGTRNFEAGILTDDQEIVEQAMNQFDELWMGKHCKTCKRKDFCPDPILAK